MAKYFKLAPGVNILHDPTQTEEDLKTLYPGQALQMKETTRVKRSLANSAIEVVDADEAKKINAKRVKGKADALKAKGEQKKDFDKSVNGENVKLQKEIDSLNKTIEEKDTEIGMLNEETDGLKKQIESGGEVMSEKKDDLEVSDELKKTYLETIGEAPKEDMTAEVMEKAIADKKK